MNEAMDYGRRTPTECIQFGISCVGIFTAIVGIVITNIWTVLAGFLLAAEGLGYFLVKSGGE